MNVAALTFGDEACASSHYRIFQYREALEHCGIRLEAWPANSFGNWASLGDFDVVIIQKRLFRAGLVRRLRRRARRLVYDIDDAIWLTHGKPHHPLTRWRTRSRLKAVSSAADLCLVANGLLQAKLSEYSDNVRVLPMSLDAKIWTRGERGRRGSVCVGWTGSPANLRYLEAIEEDLVRLQKAHAEVEFQFLCGAKPQFKSGLSFKHIPFAPGCDVEAVRGFDIGLLPLPDDPFAAYKSPIKALQYMASGAVTVAAPVGATMDIIGADRVGVFAGKPGEWFDALESLVTDADLRRRIGDAARSRFEDCFSFDRTAKELACLLTSLVENPARD